LDASSQFLPVSSSDSASFLTRLRQKSSSSEDPAAQGAFSRLNSKDSFSVQSGSFRLRDANFMRSRLRCWKRAKIANAGSTSLRIVVEAQLGLLEVREIGGEQAGVLAVDALQVSRTPWPKACRRVSTGCSACLRAWSRAPRYGPMALA
jgi:hypothetical protein